MSEPAPTTAQSAAIETQGRALMVEAGAGTGKTWVLVRRFMRLLETNPDWPLESIAAITFTEKAAREMRSRIRAAVEARALQDPADDLWQARRRGLERLQVSTIHTLCARLLRENAIAAGIDPRFQVLDEQDAALLKEEAVRATLGGISEGDVDASRDGSRDVSPGLLATLRVADLRNEMGKMLDSRGTLQRLFAGLESPEELLEKWAAGLESMRQGLWAAETAGYPDYESILDEVTGIPITDPTDRLAPAVEHAQAGVWAARRGDFREAVLRWAQINRVGGKAASWGGAETKAYLSKDLLAPLQTIGKQLAARFELVVGDLDEQAAGDLQLWRALWYRLEAVYTDLKNARQGLDFDDLELRTAELLAQNPRPPRLQAFREGIRHLMVDEFQDTNLVQQEIVYALAPPDDPGRLFVVGDAKQSIYRFRQAQVSLFNHTATDIRTATGERPVPLDTSFRTHRTLVEVHNALFAALLRPLVDDYADFEARPGALAASRPPHPELEAPVELVLLPAKDKEEQSISAAEGRVFEARWLARRLLELEAGGFLVWDKGTREYRPFRFKDAAVLFQATTSLPLYEAEFKAAGLPYLTVSGRGYYDRPEVQDLLALLAALANPADELALATALRSPLFSLSDETLYRLRWWDENGPLDRPRSYWRALSAPPETGQLSAVRRAGGILAELGAQVGRAGVWALMRLALDRTGYEAALALHDGETGRKRTNVGKLLSLARSSPDASLPRFLSQIRDLQAREAREGEAPGKEPESGAVQLMSIHASKGLEFPVVVVADLGRQKRSGFGSPYLLHDPAFGLACRVRDASGDWQDPAGYAWAGWQHEQMEEAERRRLLYVACTRAADLLILSGRIGRRDSWLADIRAALELDDEEIEPGLAEYDGFFVRIERPDDFSEFPAGAGFAPVPAAGPAEVPQLALPLPVGKAAPVISATRLAERLAEDDGLAPGLRPLLNDGEKGSTAHSRATGQQVGKVVHRALAHWDCLEYADARLDELLAVFVRREGIAAAAQAHAVEESRRMLRRFRAHPLYGEVAASSRYAELPFTLEIAGRTVQGVIDLLYRDTAGEWRLLDWKTEWLGKDESVSRQVMFQLAIYVRAAEAILGSRPRAGLCFLNPRVDVTWLGGEQMEQLVESVEI